MTTSEVRQKYLNFFKQKNHIIIPSAPILPENDSTTLFVGSGMQPLLPYLLGQKHPCGTRLTNSQKCVRTQDIEEVGDIRHLTFFEMLGNWSLGDYNKQDEVKWLFEFLIQEIKLDPKKIYVTVFEGYDQIPKDMETVILWQTLFKEIGIEANVYNNSMRLEDAKIFYYVKKNWWSRSGTPENMPIGEIGGPDTEVFYDFGLPHNLKYGPNCHPNCDCGRFAEIGNSVFMEYMKQNNGFVELKQKNIDFGGGLERITMAANNEPDAFKLDIFSSSIKTIENISGKKYGASPITDKSIRIVSDHLKASIMIMGSGITPGNLDKGYILRRLLRRAMRHANSLLKNMSLTEITKNIIDQYIEMYPELTPSKNIIINEIDKEEEKFKNVIHSGLAKFKKLEDEKIVSIDGKTAFDLYQSFGFPIELTNELAQEINITVDMEGFQQEFEKHKIISKSGSEKKFKGGLEDTSYATTKLHTATHLLHTALRIVLGNHVCQKGSNITAERLRFDFSHSKKMTEQEIQQVTNLVNEQIKMGLTMSPETMTAQEAYNVGAIGLFPDKYETKVSVYTAHNPETGYVFSKEICGGPHVKNTSELGSFKIIKEEAISAGLRRIKAVCI